jgi:hypothetical protein
MDVVKIIINNSEAPLDYPCVLDPPVPLTFAQTQNWMLKMSEDDSFYLFMHSDAEAEPGTILHLIELAEKLTAEGRKWGAIFTAYDALAAFNTEAFQSVGGWDTFLEWYAADNDMYHRLRLAGYEMIASDLPVKHDPSKTLQSDPLVHLKVNLMMPCRESYYRAKWGGNPGDERFTVPFGELRAGDGD